MDRNEYDKLAEPYAVVLTSEIAKDRTLWAAYIQEREIKRMRKIIAIGLHPVYDDFNDFLCDYFPDFSWNPASFKQDMNTILGNQTWLMLAAELKAARGFDFESQLRLALAEAIAEDGE